MEGLIKEFADYLVVLGKSEHTSKAYERNVREFINTMGINSPTEITSASMLQFLRGIMDKEAVTRNQKLSSVKSFCTYLVIMEIVEKNTIKNIPLSNTEQKIPEVMTTEEATQMIESVNDQTIYGSKKRAIFELLFGCGIRVSELVNIQLSDIDLENAQLHVVFGKGNKHRLVPVGKYAIEAIIHWLRLRQRESDYLFPSQDYDDRPTTTRSIQTMVKNHAKKFGINDGNVTPHTFRHSYATTLYSNKAQLASIQKLLGHADIRTTLIYTHISTDDVTREFHASHPRS